VRVRTNDLFFSLAHHKTNLAISDHTFFFMNCKIKITAENLLLERKNLVSVGFPKIFK